MNVLDRIIQMEHSEKIKENLEIIYEIPELCLLIERYYQDILSLKPIKRGQTIDKEKLREIISTVFHSIISELTLINNLRIAFITCDILCRVRFILTHEFQGFGPKLEKMRNEIVLNSCKKLYPCEDEFICTFLKNIYDTSLEKLNCGTIMNQMDFTCLLWNGNDKQLRELEWRLNKSDWFTQPVNIRKLFNNKNNGPLLLCRPKRIANVALLFRMLSGHNLIEANKGKSYMQIASRYIFCNEMQITAHKLNKRSCEILSNPEHHNHVIESVSKIIMAVKNV